MEEDSKLEEDIVAYIDAHYCDENLSMQSLTSRFNVSFLASTAHVCPDAAFRKQFHYSPDLYEAMRVDGANKRQVIWHLILPGIRPTIILLLIMTLGSMIRQTIRKMR